MSDRDESVEVALPPLPDAAAITYEFPDGAYDAELMIEYGRACYEAGLSYCQQPGGDVRELLKDARHRIANLSRAAVPFDDPLDGPVLRRLDAALAATEGESNG